jgi:hypothetical protein
MRRNLRNHQSGLSLVSRLRRGRGMIGRDRDHLCSRRAMMMAGMGVGGTRRKLQRAHNEGSPQQGDQSALQHQLQLYKTKWPNLEGGCIRICRYR